MTSREDIFIKLENVISACPSIVSVSRQIDSWENIPNTNFPIVFIDDNGDSDISRWTSGFITTTIDVNIRIITHSEYKTNSTELNTADKEVIAELSKSLSLNGLVDGIAIGQRSNDDLEQTYPYVSVIRNISVTYTSTIASGL